MWQLIKYLGFSGFLGGFALAYFGHKDIASVLMPLSFPLLSLGMCGPAIFKPAAEFDEKESVFGSKLSSISFMFIALVVSLSMLLHLKEEISNTLFWFGFVPFAIGIVLNIYKAWKGGYL